MIMIRDAPNCDNNGIGILRYVYNVSSDWETPPPFSFTRNKIYGSVTKWRQYALAVR